MSMRYPGGFITPTAPTVNANTAKGVWTLEEAMQYVKAGNWPTPTGNGDPYFQYNSILLPGQGTNGAQNNTFLDSSTNNFTITRNGNTTQGTFTPFSHASGYWSNYYDSTLTAWSEVLWTELSGISWTVEFWFYPIAQGGTYGGMIFGNNVSGRADACFIYHGSDGKVGITTAGSSNFTAISSTNALPLGQWTHVAITISGSSGSATGKIYLNGVLDKTQTSMNTGINSMGYALTGSRGDNAYYNIYGYLSNFRIVKNQILYTGDFTPATAPLTTTSVGTSGANVASSITGTVSTLIYNNAYLINSGATVGSAAGGNSAVGQTFQPFGTPTSAYTAATNGGSGYFDGSGDNLAVSQSAFVATGDFTVEAWFYPTRLSGYQGVFSASGNGGSTGFRITLDNSTLTFWLNNATVSSTSLPQNEWHHVAISRTGSGSNNVSCYLNGVRVGQITNTGSTTNSSLVVGQYYNDLANYYFQGYVSGLRLIVGSGIYSGSTISIPTSPPTAVTNTALLLNYTNAGVIDNAIANDSETVGGASISTAQHKWGTSSVYFDGNGDYLQFQNAPLLRLNSTEAFTIEFWVYANALSSDQHVITAYNLSSPYNGYGIGFGSGGIANTSLGFWDGTGSWRVVGTGFSTGTWYHVAIVSTGSSGKFFVNGLQQGSAFTVNSTIANTTSIIAIGAQPGGNVPFNGYIADLRITKGYPRYLYNFTAPTAAFPLFYQAAATPSSDPYFENVTMLLPGNGTNGAQNNTFLDSSTNAFTITRNGNTTQGTFTPFSKDVGAWGNYFDGSTSYLTTPSNSAFAFGTGDFTVEAWVYLTGTNYSEVFTTANGSFPTTAMRFMVTNAQKLQFYDGTNTAVSGASIPVNAWTHVAVSRSGTSVKLFINGIQDGSTTSSNNLSNTTGYIGRTWDGVIFAGYISNLRITKGGAIYTSTFTPSTTPLTTTVSSGTVSLLTCQSNRFIDNSVNAFALTVSGSPSVQSFSPFSNTAAYSTSVVSGSGYFDGSGDWLTAPSNAAFALGSVFTIEFWIYPITYGANAIFVRMGESSGDLQFGLNSGNLGLAASGVAWRLTGSAGPALNTWSHCVLVRSGTGSNQTSIFLNGTRIANGTVSDAWTTTVQAVIQATQGDTYLTKGYMSDIRVVKGTAVYDPTQSTLTVPTAPLTAISGTSLLLSGTNGGIIDNAMSNDLETVGNAQISTTQSKFGGSSMYFDGSGDYLDVLAANQLNNFSSGDWTIEAWIYRSTASANHCILNFINSAGANAGLTLQVNSSNQLVTDNGSAGALAAGTVPSNQWVHIAIARYSGTTTGYINGFAVGTTTQAPSASQYLRIGALGNGAYAYHGYINDLRVTKGIARYVQNFTPPTQAFPLL